MTTLFLSQDHFDLTKNSKIVLNGFSKFLKNNPTLEVEIQGHTDDIGDAEDNLELSKQRSLAVKEYLLSEGIDEGKSESKRLWRNTTKV